MIIKELTPHRIDEVMELFHTCFDGDPYYASHFSSPKDKITSTYPTMLWALEQWYWSVVWDMHDSDNTTYIL